MDMREQAGERRAGRSAAASDPAAAAWPGQGPVGGHRTDPDTSRCHHGMVGRRRPRDRFRDPASGGADDGTP